MARRAVLGAALAVVALLAPPAAQGRVGELDPTFGEGGRVVTPLEASKWDSIRLAVAPDGSTVIAKGLRLARFLPDGRLDLEFGEGGWLTLGDVEGLHFGLDSIAIDSLGRLLVFGTIIDATQTYDPQLMYQPAVPASWATVLRLDVHGHPDSSFGDGRGFVRSDLGMQTEVGTGIPTTRIAAAAVDSQDRPVLVASVAKVYSPCYGHSGVGWFPKGVARLTTTGALDPEFGDGDGVGAVEGFDQNPTLRLDGADRSLVAAGVEGCGGKLAIVRSGTDGMPLAGFGTDGVRIYPGVSGLAAVDASGAMVLRQGLPTDHVIRLAADGNPDTSFGQGGRAAVTMPAGVRQSLNLASIDGQGRILLAGSLSLPPLHVGSRDERGRVRDRGKRRRARRSFFVVTRLLASGKPDLAFGADGWIMTRFAKPSEVVARQAALDPQGRLLVAGSVTAPRQPGGGLVLARYLLGG